MKPSTQYREFAVECERLAQEATGEHRRKILAEMAEVWRTLAEEADAER